MADVTIDSILEWMKNNPEFQIKPASIREFLGPEYLNIAGKVRPRIADILGEIFGDEVSGVSIASYQRALVTGGIGIGKLLRPMEPVLTPRGWCPIGVLAEGDPVIGKDGFPHKVTGVYRQTDVQMYRMHFKDGTSIDSGDEHLWEIQESRTRRISGTDQIERYLEKKVVSTEWLYNEPLKRNDSYRFRIPLVDPVEFEAENLPIPPWVLGALIANGSLTKGTPTVSTDDAWIGEKLEKEIPDCIVKYYDRRFAISYPGSGRLDSNPIQAAIRDLALTVTSRDKFIPEMYKKGSSADRLELLRGLMDNDGSACGNNRSDYSTSSAQLASDVADLVRSLGGYCTVTSFDRNTGTEWQVHINMDQVCPFSMPRKVDNWKPRTNQRPARSITHIEKLEKGDGVCISIDSDDQLYVTSNYIVTHNTTFASIVLPYMCHWVLCLKDPQDYFNLLPGSRIAFMMMSTSETQAKEVIFADVVARIQNSPWFNAYHQKDPAFKNQIRFPGKDIWILPGDSVDTTFEGYNILGGVLDEGDSHKVTKQKGDYAELGYNAINARIESRFQDRGFLIVIGQMKKSNGFMAKKYAEFKKDKTSYAARMTIWESLGWHNYLNPDGSRNSFFYDPRRKKLIEKAFVALVSPEEVIEIPEVYRHSFENKPEIALRDLAGIPPAIGDPFISLVDKIEMARDKYVERVGADSPVDDNCLMPKIAKWFVAGETLKRAVHVDIAYSGDGDAMGIAMGHVSEVVEIDDEKKPYIIIDCLIRLCAPAGGEIMLSDMRRIIYDLKDERKFNIKKVTFDGFQSQDTIQQMRKRRYETDYLSVDRSILPYHDLREAIYEHRIEFPKYITTLRPGSADKVEIALDELMGLTEAGNKVDHGPDGSKDVADAMAGVCYTLMGDRQYRRGVVSIGTARKHRAESTGTDGSPVLPSGLVGLSSIKAPVPPGLLTTSMFPSGLRRRER